MKRAKMIFDFNHIDGNIDKNQLIEIESLHQFYHEKLWLFRRAYKYFKRLNLVCNLSSVSVVCGTIARGVTLYYTHFEITGGSCNLIGSNWCDLLTNRTIFCFKSHHFPSQ